MGSFYALDSITKKTICDGQDMVIQFMLPSWTSKMDKDPGIGQVFVDSFINVVKEKGLDEALKSFEQATSTWKDGSECGPKGMQVSNDGAYVDWVPVGPAIFGKYDDCGDIAPDETEENKRRIKILEDLFFGVPFGSILEAATDDRWFTYGFREGDTMWKQEGLDKDLPEPALMLFKQLCVTYMHAGTYEVLSSPDFAADEKDGVTKSKYTIKWKKEYIERIEKALPKLIKALSDEYSDNKAKKKKKTESTGDPIHDEIINKLKNQNLMREASQDIGVFRQMDRELSLIYQACITREFKGTDIKKTMDWFIETAHFMYNLSGMCMKLEQSQYGSQHQNWFGWQRIEDVMKPRIENTLIEYGYYEEDEE